MCPRCHKQFTALDIVTLGPSVTGFQCDRCEADLVDDDDSVEVKHSQERLGRLMEQLRPVIDLLKKIDEVVVPQNEFDDALRNAIPVVRVKNTLTGAMVTTSSSASDVGYAKGGLNNSTVAPLEITFTSSDEKTAADKAAEAAKRSAQMEQNALPVWHTQSTVSGEITKLGLKEAAARKERERFVGAGTEADVTDKKTADESGVQVDAIQQYYAAMAAKKAQEEAEEAAEAEEEEEEEDDDDDEEFEDVVAGPGLNTSGAAESPVSDMSRNHGTSKSGIEPPPTKKAKVSPRADGNEDDEDDDDDDDEFEDAI